MCTPYQNRKIDMCLTLFSLSPKYVLSSISMALSFYFLSIYSLPTSFPYMFKFFDSSFSFPYLQYLFSANLFSTSIYSIIGLFSFSVCLSLFLFFLNYCWSRFHIDFLPFFFPIFFIYVNISLIYTFSENLFSLYIYLFSAHLFFLPTVSMICLSLFHIFPSQYLFLSLSTCALSLSLSLSSSLTNGCVGTISHVR